MAKKPKVLRRPQGDFQPPGRKPKTAEDVPTGNNARPSWRIGALEMVDPYGWHRLDADGIRYIHGKLSNFESMKWSEILENRQNHPVSVGIISKEAQERLAALNQDDIDELISLRLSGKERVWGIREHSALKVLWWDPEHQVCPSPKKGT